MTWNIVILSCKVAACCVGLLVIPGILTGWILARKEFPGKSLLVCLTHIPMVIPPVATGYILLVVFGTKGLIGGWLNDVLGLQLAFSWYGAVLASGVVAFPLMIRSIRLAMSQVDPGLEAAARSLGAGRVWTFFTITIPLALPGIVAGCVLTFARSLGEFGATMTFAGNLPNQTQTLPLAVYSAMQVPGGQETANLLVLISIAISAVAILAAEGLSRYSKLRFETKAAR